MIMLSVEIRSELFSGFKSTGRKCDHFDNLIYSHLLCEKGQMFAGFSISDAKICTFSLFCKLNIFSNLKASLWALGNYDEHF